MKRIRTALIQYLLLFTAVGLVACSKKSETPNPDNEGIPTEEILLGPYHFLSAEYVDEQGTVVAEGYNTFLLEQGSEGGYVVSQLLGSRVRWEAQYDKENSCLILNGKGEVIDPETQAVDNRDGASWFVVLNNLIGLEKNELGEITSYGVYGLYSFSSIEEYHAETGNPRAACILRIDPEKRTPVAFETLLTSECYAIDLETMELGSYIGMLGRALPGTEIYKGAAESEYVTL